MRGDSLRDLYAKTLALLGLGVLAGAGALVDFWPSGIRLIPVSSALQLPELAPWSANVPPPEPFVAPASTAAPQLSARSAGGDFSSSVSTPSESQTVAFASEESVPMFNPDRAEAPLMVLASNVGGDPLYAVTGEAEVLEAEWVSESLGQVTDFQAGAARESSLDRIPVSDDPGFLSGALKKTGAIVRTSARTSARTGASIVDAVRVGLGAVKKALPNYRDQSFRPGT